MGDNILIVHGGWSNLSDQCFIVWCSERKPKSTRRLIIFMPPRNGTGGLMREELIELEKVPDEKVRTFTEYAGKCDRNIQRSD